MQQKLNRQAVERLWKNQLELIVRDDLRDYVVDILLAVPIEFYRKPASSTTKYHPSICNKAGGLYRHTVLAVEVARRLFELELPVFQFSQREKDCIVAALILHDICKYGEDADQRYTVFEHPLKAAEKLHYTDNLELNSLITIIKELIASHMGKYNTSDHSPIELPKPVTLAQQFVHLCDVIAEHMKIFDNIDNLTPYIKFIV